MPVEMNDDNLPVLESMLDHHWAFMKDWLRKSNPEAMQQAVDIITAKDEHAMHNFMIMMTEYPDRAAIVKQFATLAIYEANYRCLLENKDKE